MASGPGGSGSRAVGRARRAGRTAGPRRDLPRCGAASNPNPNPNISGPAAVLHLALTLTLTLTLSSPAYDPQRRFIISLVQDPNPNHALALTLTSFSTCARCFIVFLVRRS